MTEKDDDPIIQTGTQSPKTHGRSTSHRHNDDAALPDNTNAVSHSHEIYDSTRQNETEFSTSKDNNSNENEEIEERDDSQGEVNPDTPTNDTDGVPGPLHKSSRLKGYMTLVLASFINYDAADNSSGGIGVHLSVVTSSPKQSGFAVAVSIVSLAIATACFIVHFDKISPLSKLWQTLFKPKSKFEGLIIAFLTIWWTVAAGVNTSVRGPAGDGRGQFSLYYSCWVCCFTCYWMAERWWVAAGVSCHPMLGVVVLTPPDCKLSSFKSFIDSWPNRSPAWICLLILSLTTFVSHSCRRRSNLLTKQWSTDLVFGFVAEPFQVDETFRSTHSFSLRNCR